jgi:ABC-type antimicrobial peptide transport system permease subunit
VLRRTLSSIDPAVAVTRVGTGETFLGELTLFFRVVGGLSSVLGTLALVVALAGLFGVLSHVVGSRTREIGIRLALGAGRRRILSMVLREGLSPVLLGLGAGLGLAVLARFGLQPMFTRLLPALDLMALAVVPLLFLGAGVAACYLPARRAAAVDPNRALRDL